MYIEVHKYYYKYIIMVVYMSGGRNAMLLFLSSDYIISINAREYAILFFK